MRRNPEEKQGESAVRRVNSRSESEPAYQTDRPQEKKEEVPVALSCEIKQNPHMVTLDRGYESVGTEELLGLLNEVERKNAPACLYLAGDRTLLQRGVRVSIVGSRKASENGLRQARAIARAFVSRGVTIVSGLAEGIDTAAHEAAIEFGGKTVAVMGTPLDKTFPAKNRRLKNVLMRDHLVVSQFAVGSAVRPGNFPIRNRTMALVSDATVIVEAGEKSGSLHQGWEALRLGRPLFIHQRMLTDPSLTWPSEFSRYGAQPLTPQNLDAMFDFLQEHARGEFQSLAF